MHVTIYVNDSPSTVYPLHESSYRSHADLVLGENQTRLKPWLWRLPACQNTASTCLLTKVSTLHHSKSGSSVSKMCRASSEIVKSCMRSGRPLDANGALRDRALFAAAPRQALRRPLCKKNGVIASCLDDKLPYARGLLSQVCFSYFGSKCKLMHPFGADLMGNAQRRLSAPTRRGGGDVT